MPSAAFFNCRSAAVVPEAPSPLERRNIPHTTAFLPYCGVGISIATSVLISSVSESPVIVVCTLGVVPGAAGSQPFVVAAAVIADTNRSRSAEPAPATSRVKMAREAICVVLP